MWKRKNKTPKEQHEEREVEVRAAEYQRRCKTQLRMDSGNRAQGGHLVVDERCAVVVGERRVAHGEVVKPVREGGTAGRRSIREGVLAERLEP